MMSSQRTLLLISLPARHVLHVHRAGADGQPVLERMIPGATVAALRALAAEDYPGAPLDVRDHSAASHEPPPPQFQRAFARV